MARSQMPDKKLRIVRTMKQPLDVERQVHQLQKLHGLRIMYETKGQLKAKYGDQQKVWRIVYVANGNWQLQRFHELPQGTDLRIERQWVAHQRPTDYETAHSQLKRRDHQIQASA